MYAILNDQGTACSETALCNKHIKYSEHRLKAWYNVKSQEDVIDNFHVFTPDNEALECIICGATINNE